MKRLAATINLWLAKRTAQRRAIHRCVSMGGHWWEPADAMIGWKCKFCPATTDGMPKDGPGAEPL